jgi:hypothetical protein
VGKNGGVSNNRRRAVDRIIELMPMDAVVRQVDVQAIIDRVDLNALMERVDVQRIIDRVDINALMERVDLNELLDRVDVNAIVSRVDVEDIVARTEIGQVVVSSTTGLVTRGLDFVRAQGVGLDQWSNRWVDRLLRRSPADTPLGPGLPASGTGTEATS